MPESITIKLAAREYTIKRLTLRQSRTIGMAVTANPPPEQDEFTYAIDQAVTVVSAALSRDNPDFTADTLLDAEVSPKELMAISGSILEFSGFVKTKDLASGEDVPGAA